MKHFAWVVLALCCAAPAAAEEVKVFTPSGSGTAPIYMNGRLVRIDRAAGTITVRTDRGQRVMNVDRQTLATLASVRPGSDVIVGVNVSGTGASERRIVTEVRASGTVNNLGRGRVTASAAGSGMTITPGKTSAIGTATATPGLSAPVRGRETSVMPRPTTSVPGSAVPNANGTFTNDSLPRPPALPQSPNDGLDRNPATTGVQPAPGAQPIPGIQGPSGVQPVPGAQPLPGTAVGSTTQPVPGAQPLPNAQGTSATQVPGAQPLPGRGVTGETALNPGLTTQPVPGSAGSGINSGAVGQPANPGMVPLPVPGTGGQSAVNAGATGGVSTGINTGGVATTGVGGLPASPTGVATAGVGGTPAAGGGARGGGAGAGGARGGGGAVGGGSPILGPSVPQLGFTGGGINSQIPQVPPPSAGTLNTPVLPVPSVATGMIVPQTPNEVATLRELASRDFDMSVAVLAARAADVDRAWVAYRSQCVTTTGPLNNRPREWFALLDGSLVAPTEDICEANFNDVSRLAQGLEAALETARDTARRADVLPGRMREVLQRYNLDL